MAYVLPQVLVHQDFNIAPTAVVDPLRAFIFGPHYELKRYAVSAEKSQIGLGSYDYTQETCYAWPNRPAGGIVDQSWTKLFIDDAWIKYYRNPAGDADTVLVNTTYRNRIRANTTVFKTYEDYTRSASLYSRDVTVGDGVRINAVGTDNEVYNIETKVTGFVNETVPAVISASTGHADNETTQIANTAVTTSVTEVSITEDATAYDGLEDGIISEVYTIEVITSSTEGNAETAVLRVTSASGLDDDYELTPEPYGTPTAIGARGLTVTFNPESSLSSPGEEVNLEEGMIWVVEVDQAFTAPTTTSNTAGTYTGTADTTYIVEVTKGGVIGTDVPEIMVSTTTGSDFGGPYTITGSGAGYPILIGNYGVSVYFTGTDVCAGDKYLIAVTAEGLGAIKTLTLAKTLPTELLTVDLTVELFIIDDIQVSKNRIGSAPNTNYTMSETEICVADGITHTMSTWTDSDGDELPIPVVAGTMYVEYRSLIQTYATAIHTISDVSEVADTLGTISSDNPLAMGVYKALTNCNGTAVKFMAVPTNDLAGYSEVLEAAMERDDVYGFVPLTFDREIQNLVAAHVANLSTPENGGWRIAFVCVPSVTTSAIYTTIDDAAILATISDDPQTSGTQYTWVECTDADFITAGVLPGDKLRCNYVSDGFDTWTYEEYTVDSVIAEDTIRLLTGPSAEITTASKIEIWRNLNKEQMADDIAEGSGSFGTRRVRNIWPDYIGSAGVQLPGYYLCAALAGLRSGVAPHQGLTNVEILGFDDASKSFEYFSRSQLNTLAEAGTWIVTEDKDGTVHTRHQVTTGDYADLNKREDSVTTNVDAISYYMLRTFAPYIGRANVTPTFITTLKNILEMAFRSLISKPYSASLGPQLIDFTVVEFRQHTILKDRIIANVSLSLPYPFNNFELHLVI